MSLESVTEEWMEQLDKGVVPLYLMALRAQLASQAVYYANLSAETLSLGGEAAAFGAGALPVVTMVGVYVALGAGYYQARELAREENNKSGFSQGFVMGLLGWEWHQATNRFGRWGVLNINQFDEAINVIRVKAYNAGLKAGYLAAVALPPAAKKAYLSRIRKLAHGAQAGNWTRNDQVSYVIELAAAGLVHGVIRPF